MAREKAAEVRAMLLDGKDPGHERETEKRQNAATFGPFALNLIDDIEGGFKNPKHRQQWRNTLTT
jgi:hypothetical protein